MGPQIGMLRGWVKTHKFFVSLVPGLSEGSLTGKAGASHNWVTPSLVET